MKFLVKMCLIIMLKVTKKTRLCPLSRKYNLRKTTGGSIDPPDFLGLNLQIKTSNYFAEFFNGCHQS